MTATFSILNTAERLPETNDSGLRAPSDIFRRKAAEYPVPAEEPSPSERPAAGESAPAEKPDGLRDRTERFLDQAAPFLTRHQEQIIAAAAGGLDAAHVAECRYYLRRARLAAGKAPEPAGPGSKILDLVQDYLEASHLPPLQMEIVLLLARGYDARTISEAEYLLSRV